MCGHVRDRYNKECLVFDFALFSSHSFGFLGSVLVFISSTCLAQQQRSNAGAHSLGFSLFNLVYGACCYSPASD